MRSEDPWALLLDYCALAREKPGFDAEEREELEAVASALRTAAAAARDNGEWMRILAEAVLRPSLPTIATPLPTCTTLRDQRWLRDWAARDQESLRLALARFATPDAAPIDRYSDFATAADAAGVAARSGDDARALLTFGSLLNFAVDPASLPFVRPGPYRQLAAILGHGLAAAASPAEHYGQHLSLAGEVRDRLEAAGVEIRDMLDVGSLILNAAAVHEFWGPGRRCSGLPTNRSRSSPGGDETAYLSVCAIYRDEAPYLREWVELHRLAGVEHFFLYDNASADEHREVLAPRIDDGTVLVHEWPRERGQIPAYEHCLATHGAQSRWIAFIDVDEFLFSPTGRPLPDLLGDYEAFPGVGVNWAVFGPSGHQTKPPGTVVESYTRLLDVPDNRTIKSIVDPARTVRCENVHQFTHRCSATVDENGYPVLGYYTKSVSSSQLRVNHYLTKSVAEFRKRSERARPDQFGSARPSSLDHIIAAETSSSRHDEAILRYLPQLRAVLS